MNDIEASMDGLKSRRLVVIGVFLAVAVTLLANAAGCATARSVAAETITTAAQLVSETSKQVQEVDKARQSDIIGEAVKTGDVVKAAAKLKTWRAQRDRIYRALDATSGAISAAGKVLLGVAKGDLASLTSSIMQAVQDLVTACKDAGIIPGGGV